MPEEKVVPDLNELAASLKSSTARLLKELEAKAEEACHLHRLAEDAEDPDAELEASIYYNTIQALQEAANDAQHAAKYLLGHIDASGELYLHTNGRFRLPTTDGRDDYFEFTCGYRIELWDEQEQRWMYGNVEYADQYTHGYYFKPARLGLQPGMKARHRYINLWDD